MTCNSGSPATDPPVPGDSYAILVSPFHLSTDPPVPIARQLVAVRCSQATTVGAGPQNSLDNGMEAEIPFVAQPQRAAHLGLPAMEEERVEDVDILPRPSRRLVLLGAGSVLGSHNRFSPLAVDGDEPMDVADHQDAVVVHDEGSEVSVDEEPEPPTAPDPEVVTTRGLTPAIRAALTELDGVDLPHEFTRRAAIMKTVPHFLRGPFRNALRVAGKGRSSGSKSVEERKGLEIVRVPSQTLVVQTTKRR